jgi:L-type amino acid transporter 9
VVAHLVDPNSSLSGSRDWFTKNWFESRQSVSEGRTVDWTSLSEWERFGHYSAAIYASLWAYDGWDNVSDLPPQVLLCSYMLLRNNEADSHS